MKKSHLYIGLAALFAAMAALGLYYGNLPDTVAVHWDGNGIANGYAPRWQLWLIGPGLIALLLAMPYLVSWLSPPKFKLDSFRNTLSYQSLVLALMMAVLFGMMLATALGYQLMRPRLGWLAVYTVLILVGSPMGKVRRNFFIGIRTPWTLASEAVWDATHRLAGWLMVASGALGYVAVFLGVRSPVHIVLAAGWSVIAVLYSFVLSKRIEKQGQL